MRANIDDVVAGSGAALLMVTLTGMVVDLGAGVVPGVPLTMMLGLGLLSWPSASTPRMRSRRSSSP